MKEAFRAPDRLHYKLSETGNLLLLPRRSFHALLPRRTRKMDPISRRNAPSGVAAKILAWEGR